MFKNTLKIYLEDSLLQYFSNNYLVLVFAIKIICINHITDL